MRPARRRVPRQSCPSRRDPQQAHRSVWAIYGEEHCIETPRGERLKVMDALFSDSSVTHSRHWGSSTSKILSGFVGDLVKAATKPSVIVIDNASIHRALAIQPALKLPEKKGIRLKFLPPHSPEINRIETLWRLMKHRWMALTWRTKEQLGRAVNHVFANFGGQFKIDL
jgi:hypothetical protein